MIKLESCNINIVLYEPEIPANTGNIGRLCLGAGAELHIIRPIKFLLDDRSLKRAGLDYWQHLNPKIHDSLEQALKGADPARCFYCSTKAVTSYTDIKFRKGDYLIFGPESRGLPGSLLEANSANAITIAMTDSIRSINLANSVAIILYEALRQISSLD